MVFSAFFPGFRKTSRRSWNALRYGVSPSLETPRCGESHRRVSDPCLWQVLTCTSSLAYSPSPVERLVCYLDFALKLAKTRVKAEKYVDREQPPAESNLRVSEDCAGLVVEGAVAILTEIRLELSVASVSDRSGQNGSEDSYHRHASEPVGAGLLRPIPTQTHPAESFVSGTADAVPLSSLTL